jgi:hypothetical protein
MTKVFNILVGMHGHVSQSKGEMNEIQPEAIMSEGN